MKASPSERILPASEPRTGFTVMIVQGAMCHRQLEEYFDKLTLIKHLADKYSGVRFGNRLLQLPLRV